MEDHAAIMRKGREYEEARRLYFDRIAGCDCCDCGLMGLLIRAFSKARAAACKAKLKQWATIIAMRMM